MLGVEYAVIIAASSILLMVHVVAGPMGWLEYGVKIGEVVHRCSCKPCLLSDTIYSIKNCALHGNDSLCDCLLSSCRCSSYGTLAKRGLFSCFKNIASQVKDDDWGSEAMEEDAQVTVDVPLDEAVVGTGITDEQFPGDYPDDPIVEKPKLIPIQQRPNILKLQDGKLSFEDFKTFVKSDWPNIKMSLKDNPLLKSMTESQMEEASRLADAVDPSIKFDEESRVKWPERDASWRNRFWEAAIKLRDHIDAGNSFGSLDDFYDILGPWRSFVKVEAEMRTISANTKKTSLFDLNDIYSEVVRFFGQRVATDIPVTTAVRVQYAGLLGDINEPGGTTLDFFNKLRSGSYELPGKTKLIIDDDLPQVNLNGKWPFINLELQMRKSGGNPISPISYSIDMKARNPKMNAWMVFNRLRTPEMADYFTKSLQSIFETDSSSSSRLPLEILSERIAKVHWIIAVHSPFQRGSAAIADLVTATAYLKHGYQFPGWRVGVSADVTALCTPEPTAFISKFTSLMEGGVDGIKALNE